MAWLAVDKHGDETISNVRPRRDKFVYIWVVNEFNPYDEEQIIELSRKIINKGITWKVNI